MSDSTSVTSRRNRHKSTDDGVQSYQKQRRLQFPIVCLTLHGIFIILFGVFIRYNPHQAIAPWNQENLTDGTKAEQEQPDYETSSIFDIENGPKNKQYIDIYYPMFEDIQVMVFIGFGFLIAFMRFFCLTAVTMNFMLACFALEWALLMNGWFQWAHRPHTTSPDAPSFACSWGMENHHGNCSPIDIVTITNSLFACTTVLISAGALLGKITPTQMLINAVLEITIYAVNRWIIIDLLEANDSGHGMSVHAFGAYWGLAAAAVIWPTKKKLAEAPGAREAYANELFVFLGTLFLFAFWPSWNAAQDVGIERHRAVVNTFLAIVSSCITTYALSAVLDKHGRFTVQHLQNATLAGGVGIGSIANGVVHPFGALLIGMMAGVISVMGYQYLTPLLNKLGAHDSAGVHNLHGLPGIYASVVSAIVAGAVTAKGMGSVRAELEIFPAMSPESARLDPSNKAYIHEDAREGDYPSSDRNQTWQGGLQFAAVLITIALSVAGGIVSGLIMRFMPKLDKPDDDKLGQDSEFYVPHWEELGGDDAPLHSNNSMYDMRMQDGGSSASGSRRSSNAGEAETKA